MVNYKHILQNIFNYKYLSQDQVKGFNNYKYSSIDNSPVAVYISHPFWNQVVKLYPKWLAPNVLTFGGMLLVMIGFAVVSYYDYYLYASSATTPDPPIPRWVWLFLSITTFLAHVMDGTDGKQARRTGTSGPTGELFDHGIDSWLTVPFTVTIYSVFGRLDFSVSAFRQLLALMSVQLVFIITHWEKYNTGVLFLSWCYDISQYGLAIVYFITWCAGGHYVWKFTISIFHLDITPANVNEIIFYIGCFGMSIPMSFYNISKAMKNKTCKRDNIYEAMLPMFSTTVLFTTAIVWGQTSPTAVLDLDPRAYFWAMGTVFSNIACRLIVAQMTSTRCQPFNWLVAVFVFLASFCMIWRSIGVLELYILRFLAIFVTCAHIHYTACVIRQMCAHFGINCFSIKKLNDEAKESLIVSVEDKSSLVDGSNLVEEKYFSTETAADV